jgi:hypothetical protein
MSRNAAIQCHSAITFHHLDGQKVFNRTMPIRWSNQSYFSDPPWRNPDWKLSKGRNLIDITITSSGAKCKGLFRLINNVGQKDFRIENARPEDFKKI